MIAADFGVGEFFLALLAFALFALWLFLVVNVFVDIMRSADLSGWAKAAWAVGILVFPYLGVFVYIVARGAHMSANLTADRIAGY